MHVSTAVAFWPFLALLFRVGNDLIARKEAFPVLVNNARKVRNRRVVDGRRLSLSGRPDSRQVSTGQDG